METLDQYQRKKELVRELERQIRNEAFEYVAMLLETGKLIPRDGRYDTAAAEAVRQLKG